MGVASRFWRNGEKGRKGSEMTPEQKAAMTAMLKKHILSAENTLKTLQAFSGNLTLLSASVATDERATQELHFVNQGLQEVLQEFNDAHK